MDAQSSPSTGRRRGGRPRKSDDERRGKFVGFWVTTPELAALEERADASGAPSVSAYLRAAEQGGAAPVARTGRIAAVAPIVAQLGRLGNNLNQCLREARFGTFSASVAAAAEDALQALAAYLRQLAAADDPEA